MNWDMLIGNLAFFGILALIYFLRGKRSKNIATFLSIAYCSIMQMYFIIDKKYWIIPIFTVVGLISIYLLYLTEKKYKDEKKIYPKNKFVFALLAYFTGMFGGHRFYLQQKVLAAFYILFFWTVIPMFISFIETVIYLIIPKKTFDNRYNNALSEDAQIKHEKKHNAVPQTTNNIPFNNNKTENVTDMHINGNIPIGECKVRGTKGNYVIAIIVNGVAYRFTVEDGQITKYWKTGMSKESSYGV